MDLSQLVSDKVAGVARGVKREGMRQAYMHASNLDGFYTPSTFVFKYKLLYVEHNTTEKHSYK